MEFPDRKEECAELERVLNPSTPPKFVVVFGRRRLGKSTLIKRVLTKRDIYYMAGDFVDHVQRDMLRDQLSELFPAIVLLAKLMEKASKLAFAQNKKIVPVLFLKTSPRI